MNEPLIPDGLDPAHPVVRKEYSLFTASIESTVDSVGAWIDQRAKGGVIFGPSQYGKSNGLANWLQAELQRRLRGEVPLMFWSYEPSGSASQLHNKLRRAAGGGHPLRQKRDALSDLVEKLIARAYRSDARYTMIVIDEAQAMTEREWIWMVQLHSRAELEGIQLAVVPVISLQFNQRPYELAHTGSAHASARFMLYEHQFHGMRSVEELRAVLLGYDEDSEWPAGSGTSYTAGIAPRPFEAGLRLSAYAAQLWTALFQNLPSGYKGPHDYPMQSVTLAARNVLMRLAGSGAAWENCVTQDGWNQAVAMTGHKAHMALVSLYAGHR